MTKPILTMALAAAATFALASNAFAAPLDLSDTQMDSVAAGAFVCPVIKTDGVLNAGGFALGDTGYYSIVTATDINVPVGATNGNGAGSPGGDFSAPGDTDYTAIWY